MFENIFLRKKANRNKLIAYGFREDAEMLKYALDIMEETFVLNIMVDVNGAVETSLIEKENGEEYILYKTNASGAYVGEVRAAIETILSDIAEQCYEPSVFKTLQAQRIIEYVKRKYGDELEYLWTKFPDNAVWRRKDNKKWYGVILTIQKNKLGFDDRNIVEIIDLRSMPEKMEGLLSQEGYFPGYHMNKKNWYTIILDGNIPEEEIYKRIDESYRLVGKTKK